MARVFRVIVEGGGRNLYYIRARDDVFHVFHHRVNVVWDEENLVGVADDANEAIEMVKEHSGEEIDSIDEEDD